jgi:3-oxoacyl-[acyl-carrier protein] reductase
MSLGVGVVSVLVMRPLRPSALALPEEFADACAFLCSAQAGFISGQNLQLDGGSYHGLL